MSHRLALIIGNSEYEDTNLAQLVTPGGDANDFAEVLRDPEVGGFDEVAVHINKSRSTIQRVIARFFKQKKPNDLLLLYFSGHGVRDERGNLYLAVKDTEHDLLSGSAIRSTFITEEMDRSRSKRQVLMLDCCHSGAFEGTKGSSGTSVGTATAFEGTGYGRVVLTATDATQYAWEGDQVIGEAENSVFTHYMIQGLRTGEADIDGDGEITLDELYDYVYAQVMSQTAKQTPGKWSYKQQGDIVIARNPNLVVKPVGSPIELEHVAESSHSGTRESADDKLSRSQTTDKLPSFDDDNIVPVEEKLTLEKLALPSKKRPPRSSGKISGWDLKPWYRYIDTLLNQIGESLWPPSGSSFLFFSNKVPGHKIYKDYSLSPSHWYLYDAKTATSKEISRHHQPDNNDDYFPERRGTDIVTYLNEVIGYELVLVHNGFKIYPGEVEVSFDPDKLVNSLLKVVNESKGIPLAFKTEERFSA